MPFEELNLSVLPSDVIRAIIRITPGSINAMQLISPSWRTLSLEYLSNRSRLPSITWAVWQMGFYASDPISFHNMPTELRGYFGLNRCEVTRSHFDSEKSYKLTIGAPDIINYIFARTSRLQKFEIILRANIRDLSKSAMETHINNIKLAINSHKPLAVEVMSFELPASRERSNLELNMKDLTLIAGLLKGHQIMNLIVTMECGHDIELWFLWEQQLCAFLTQAARLFSSMELRFNRYQWGLNTSPLFTPGDNETKRNWSRAVAELATKLNINVEIIFTGRDFKIRTVKR